MDNQNGKYKIYKYTVRTVNRVNNSSPEGDHSVTLTEYIYIYIYAHLKGEDSVLTETEYTSC